MTDPFLTAKEIQGLTDRVQHGAQKRQLDAMGISYLVRADNSLAVLWSNVNKVLNGATPARPRKTTPDWSAAQ